MQTIEPETLMRYADGELDALECAEVEARLAYDRTAEETVADLRERRALVAAAFRQNDVAPRSDLVAVIDAGLAERTRRQRDGIRRWLLPLAASVLVAVLGSALAFYVADQRIDGAIDRMLAAQANDQALMASTLLNALERHRSGETVVWSNAESGAAGSVTPLRTFRSASGKWCREFERIVTAPGGQDSRIGIACRQDDAGWQLALERPKGV